MNCVALVPDSEGTSRPLRAMPAQDRFSKENQALASICVRFATVREQRHPKGERL